MIVPDITWIAAVAPITYVGATPVSADIDAKTWCLGLNRLSNASRKETKAVIPVDLHGNIPAIDNIREVARRHSIAVIEDPAGTIGSE